MVGAHFLLLVELENLVPELVVPSMDSRSLISIIKRVITDTSFRESAVTKISKYADETSWERVARLYVKAYEKVFQGQKIEIEII